MYEHKIIIQIIRNRVLLAEASQFQIIFHRPVHLADRDLDAEYRADLARSATHAFRLET